MQYTAHALAVHPSEQRAQSEPSVQRDAWAEERTIGSSNRPKLLAMFPKLYTMLCLQGRDGRLFAGRGRETGSTGRPRLHRKSRALRAHRQQC